MTSHPFFISYAQNEQNTPYTGSFFLHDIFANTGKPRKTALFGSCGEYAQ